MAGTHTGHFLWAFLSSAKEILTGTCRLNLAHVYEVPNVVVSLRCTLSGVWMWDAKYTGTLGNTVGAQLSLIHYEKPNPGFSSPALPKQPTLSPHLWWLYSAAYPMVYLKKVIGLDKSFTPLLTLYSYASMKNVSYPKALFTSDLNTQMLSCEELAETIRGVSQKRFFFLHQDTSGFWV